MKKCLVTLRLLQDLYLYVAIGRPKLVFRTHYRLMLVKSIAECSKGSMLQYFRPSLSYYLPLRSLFCLFLSGCLNKTGLTVLPLKDQAVMWLNILHEFAGCFAPTPSSFFW